MFAVHGFSSNRIYQDKVWPKTLCPSAIIGRMAQFNGGNYSAKPNYKNPTIYVQTASISKHDQTWENRCSVITTHILCWVIRNALPTKTGGTGDGLWSPPQPCECLPQH